MFAAETRQISAVDIMQMCSITSRPNKPFTLSSTYYRYYFD